MPGLGEVAAAHHLHEPLVFSLEPLRAHARFWLGKVRTYVPFSPATLDESIEELLDAVLHRFFVDPEGRRWNALVEHFRWTEDPRAALVEFSNVLTSILNHSVGPLMPSLWYRYQISREILILTPTLPTLHDYEERIAVMADPDEGWVPRRHRQ